MTSQPTARSCKDDMQVAELRHSSGDAEIRQANECAGEPSQTRVNEGEGHAMVSKRTVMLVGRTRQLEARRARASRLAVDRQ